MYSFTKYNMMNDSEGMNRVLAEEKSVLATNTSIRILLYCLMFIKFKNEYFILFFKKILIVNYIYIYI